MPNITATDLEVNESFLPPCHGFALLCCNLLFPVQCIYLHKLELVWKNLGIQSRDTRHLLHFRERWKEEKRAITNVYS